MVAHSVKHDYILFHLVHATAQVRVVRRDLDHGFIAAFMSWRVWIGLLRMLGQARAKPGVLKDN